jgi:hypothetical protein
VLGDGGGGEAGKPSIVGDVENCRTGGRPVLGDGGSGGSEGEAGERLELGGGVLWVMSQVLRILRAHDWKVAIEIAVSLWDSATAMDQLQRLDDAITEATEVGMLEGWTVHCDECDVMRWVNEGTHLPEPWFCPICLSTKDASLYGTRLKPSALGRTFLFKVVKAKVTHAIAETIMSMMILCDSKRSEDDDEDCEHVNIKSGTEAQEHETLQVTEFYCPEVESNLVEWPPLRGMAVEEVSMDVADVKPVKATMLEDLDIGWWLQHARCQKMSRKHRNGRRRSRRKAMAVLLYLPARRKKMALEGRVRASKDISVEKCPLERRLRRRRNRRIMRMKKVVKKVKQEVKCDEYSKNCVEFEFRKTDVWGWVLGVRVRILVGEVIGWGTRSVLSCSMVRGQIVV